MLFPLANFTFPLTLEFFSWLTALGLFAAIGLPIVWLGYRSLNGLGPTRKWTAIVVRLIVLALFVLILGGARWDRVHTDLDVIVLRDVSGSTELVHNYPDSAKSSLTDQIDQYLRNVSDEKLGHKPADDRIGVISFQDNALIDAMPNPKLMLEAKSIRKEEAGTDPAAAIQLGLATMRREAMHRMLLIWDGNKTQGDLDAAISAAVAQHVPIDVMPLNYNVTNEVLVQSFSAPTMKNEKEPFSLTLVLQSTNNHPVTGTVTVYRQERVMETRKVTVNPGANPYRFKVPGLTQGGVHQFRATFDIDPPVAVAGGKAPVSGDTLGQNNSGTAFTFVKGRGQTLYVDNMRDDQGFHLLRALGSEGIEIEDKNHIKPANFPNSLIELQTYDSIILANVPAGAGGLSDDQFKMLYNYVHDMGGGLLCIGGEDTFGAGGWQGRKIEDVLPVNMDIPAQRQIPKGALVLIFHSIEFADGNYWGEQCGIKAAEALSGRDEIGVISYSGNNGPQSLNGASWDFPLKEKGDGTAVTAAIKGMQQGDMPDFHSVMDLALNGVNGQGGLIRSNARQKHVIIISDGDPAPPSAALVAAYNAAQVTVSTVSVYPHNADPDKLPPNMKNIAKDLKGKAYGPINDNPNQLPQIFIKEASIVRRSLIQESLEPNPPIAINMKESSNQFMKGINGTIPTGTRGMVLTSKKQSPQIDLAMTAGKNDDPLLAYWQAGLGRVICYTSDAMPKWNADMVSSTGYSKFWSQMLRAVARPPMSTDFTVQTSQDGGKGKVLVEAINRDNAFLNFLNFGGKILGPDGQAMDVKVVQTGPGTYEGEFDTKQPGNYVVALNYAGQKGEKGTLTSGVAVNQSPELRDLSSNESSLNEVARRTNGRVLPAFDVANANLFTRDKLLPSNSPLPIWDILIPILLGMILLDVAARRIAWDLESIRRMMATAKGAVESYTTVRKVESTQTMDALKSTRAQVGEEKFKAMAEGKQPAVPAGDRPDPTHKFEAKGVEGDISSVVGGATDKPLPSAPKKIEPKGTQPGKPDTMGGLMEAKRRAQQKIRDQEEGKK
ncbi:VWA domain-containing protein [soil metagenome]